MPTIIGEDKTVFKQITCKHCASILQYTPAEVKMYEGKDYSCGAGGCKYIICPKCNTEVVIRCW